MRHYKPYLQFSKTIRYNYHRTIHYTARKHPSQQTHLQNVGPMASLLKTRSVIRFKGPDTVKFLQGLLTNDVRRFSEPLGEKSSTLPTPTPNLAAVSVPPMYAALLTPQGRFLCDMFLYRPPRADEKHDSTWSGPGSDQEPGELDLLADVDASVLEELLKTLMKYRLRSMVDIENVSEYFSCWQ
ncbi:unnamed protein product [Ilex paraguariensis]|uniref:Uncharacterized protein n=1 Tax=Ilex paraguariensis TaxID=185542 RepID=A0ABC8TUI6_9AQUA